MNFRLLPRDVAALMSGHHVRQISAPGGAGALLSPLDRANHRCFELEVHSHGRHVRGQEMMLDRNESPKHDVMSCPRELKPELKIREIDPETGEILSEKVWNDPAFKFLDEDENVIRKSPWRTTPKGLMRVRGPRKQISARHARKLEALNSEVIDEIVKAAEGIFGKRRPHDVDDLHPVKQFQGYRTTNYKTGEKYSGATKSSRRESFKPVGEGAPKMDEEKMSRLILAAKKTFGL